ncbi:hypothetical protein HNQ52_002466 [Chiayiivirga flava]|uniref:Carboxypeptidase Q n=2 Tax=Chiayiivirga flava TaxID=659595 RepID=A0A7W8D6N3_9GAMM|nr:M28 family peptidase [Chiayiivirga flava]MBB5208916.1 hypothetical protein [Chiayiivirga flava]
MIRSALALLLLVPFALHAQQASPDLSDDALAVAAQLRETALAGSGAYALVESLTTEVGPRMAGTPGDVAAVAWAKAAFERNGFDTVSTQPVTFPAWRRGEERAAVLSPFPQPLHVTALGLSDGTGGTPLQAEVVEFESLQALKDAPADAARGRIAYVSLRMERKRDGGGYGIAGQARTHGAGVAASKGAVGYLLRSIGTDSDRLPHTGMQRYPDGVARIPAAALSNPDADLLSNMLRRGQPVTVQLELDVGTQGEATSYNVIGEIRGREKPDEVVIIGGHLDSWDLGTGAIDDAAGVAITMRAGALIGALPTPPKRTIRVIAFANEEQGIVGAKTYAAAQDDAAIVRHRIGAESDFGAGRIYGFATSALPAASEATVQQIAAALAPLGIDYLPGKGGAGPDIGPMAQRGMAWGWLAQDGSDYFDYHHTANDTLDKVDAAALDQQVAAYAVFAYLAAESDAGFGSTPQTPPAAD